MKFSAWLAFQDVRPDQVAALAVREWPEDGNLGTFEWHLLEEYLDRYDRDIFRAQREAQPMLEALRQAWREWGSEQ